MAKRISRRELKEKIRNLEYLNKTYAWSLDDYRQKYKELEKRFQELGSKVEMFNLKGSGIECIEIEPQPWGQYCRLAGYVPEAQMPAVKERLISQIVRGLMETNLVQIIDHSGWEPFEEKTIGAKLYVVPWEKLVKKEQIRKQMFFATKLQLIATD